MSTKQSNIHAFRAAVCGPTQMHNREDLFARDSASKLKFKIQMIQIQGITKLVRGCGVHRY